METSIMTLNKIKSKLKQVPEDKLDEIYDFVEFILTRSTEETVTQKLPSTVSSKRMSSGNFIAWSHISWSRSP